MRSEFTKLRDIETEYVRLLEISSQGEEKIKLYKSGSVPMGQLSEHIEFLTAEIKKLKGQLLSDGVVQPIQD